MKITKTLQGIITEGFLQKERELNSKWDSKVSELKMNFIETVEKDKEVQELLTLEKKLSKKYQDLLGQDNFLKFNGGCRGSRSFFEQGRKIEESIRIINRNQDTEYMRELNKIHSANRELLLKLEYEKDSEKLVDILSEYNITI